MNLGPNVKLQQIDPYVSQQFCGRQENTSGEHDLSEIWRADEKGPNGVLL
jgi:hypothetical protein